MPKPFLFAVKNRLVRARTYILFADGYILINLNVFFTAALCKGLNMNNDTSSLCQWYKCSDSSSQYVEFGKRVFEADLATFTSAESHTANRLFLFDKHASQAAREYIFVNSRPLPGNGTP